MGSKKFLKIPAVAIVLGILVVGGASAALVNYLSNTVGADVTVEQALQLRVESYSASSMDISEGSEYGEDIVVDMPAYTGESAEMEVSVRNRGLDDIEARSMATWSSNQVTVSGDDFEYAKATTPGDDTYDMSDQAVCTDWFEEGGCREVSVCYGRTNGPNGGFMVPAESNSSEDPTLIELKLANNIQAAKYKFRMKMVPPSECPSSDD